MMPEPTTYLRPAQTPVRPFPWFCPHCRRKEVRRATIPYQCTRILNGQPITIVLAKLNVPRCDNCGELVFDYEAEDQIQRAYEIQAGAVPASSQAVTHAIESRNSAQPKPNKPRKRRKK